nr:biotin transporter BioY [Scopulibacillus darangshiensis]
MKTKSLILVTLFAALTAIGGFIRIPIPYVPFTLQIVSVYLSGALLGAKRGMMSQTLYVLVGLAGAPIFAEGGGPSYIFQPTFGYLIGFVLGAGVIGWVNQKMKSARLTNLLFANLCGLAVIYLIGCIWLYGDLRFILSTPITIKYAIVIGCLVSLPGDLLLGTLCTYLSARLVKVIKPEHIKLKEVKKVG